MDQAIYLFCVARSGLPPLEAVSIEEVQGLAAVWTTVAREEFCGPSAEQRMTDLSWIAPLACRHEQVIEQVMRHSPVLPVRFGTLFSTLENLASLLAAHRELIADFLDRVGDQQEWAIKGSLDRARARDRLGAELADGPPSSTSPGLQYLRERRLRDQVDRKLNTWLRQTCHDIARELTACASDFRERPLVRLGSEPLVNWAFLVPQPSRAGFRAELDQINAKYAPEGLAFELSGPWPPYSFAPSIPAR